MNGEPPRRAPAEPTRVSRDAKGIALLLAIAGCPFAAFAAGSFSFATDAWWPDLAACAFVLAEIPLVLAFRAWSRTR